MMRAVSAEIQVDDETRAALLLFNERLEEAAAEERAKKRIAKAERAKDEAATRVRRVNEDLESSADAKAEAEAAYKAALAELARITENPHDRPPAAAEKPRDEADAEPAKISADEADAEPAEISADEEGAEPVGATTESE